MKTNFNPTIASQYKSRSQITRVLSEDWLASEGFCPNCGKEIYQYENNLAVKDFCCPDCDEDYELKAQKGNIDKRVSDGAYGTMIERLNERKPPNLFVLSYNNNKVTNLIVIPSHFFIPDIIQKRNPLSKTSRRAGWVGCNILVQNIPSSGKVFYIRDGQIKPKEEVLNNWEKTLFLRNIRKAELKGWALDIMNCIDALGRNKFLLKDIYAFEVYLAKKHPENKHIKDKIRQQLQFLRDKGYLKFIKQGVYELT